jgi:hypothetical protein
MLRRSNILTAAALGLCCALAPAAADPFTDAERKLVDEYTERSPGAHHSQPGPFTDSERKICLGAAGASVRASAQPYLGPWPARGSADRGARPWSPAGGAIDEKNSGPDGQLGAPALVEVGAAGWGLVMERTVVRPLLGDLEAAFPGAPLQFAGGSCQPAEAAAVEHCWGGRGCVR